MAYNYLIAIAFLLLIVYFILNKQYTTVALAIIIFVLFYVFTGNYVGVFL